MVPEKEMEQSLGLFLRQYEELRPLLSNEEEKKFRLNLIQMMVTLKPSIEPFFKYCPHIPTRKQWLFLALENEEAFFGGAAGGGKSDALLMAALMYVEKTKYDAILIRRTYADLSQPDALIPRSHEWFGPTDAHWKEKEKIWTFPGGGTISFGHLDNENAKYQYQGGAYQFVGFDEVTQFLEDQYLYLHTRIRSLRGSGIPARIRSSANPDGRGFEWVKRRFVKPGHPDKPFIPSKLSDNPHLEQEAYKAILSKLGSTLKAKYLEGNWDVRPDGKKFKAEWFEIVDGYPKFRATCRYWDLAATEAKIGKDPDWTVGTLEGITKDDEIYVIDVKRFRATAGTVKKLIKQTAELDGKRTKVRIEQEGGSAGKFVDEDFAKFMLGFDYKGIPSTGSKEVRATPFASYAENGNVKLLAGEWNSEWLDEMVSFPDGEHDDQIDSASGAFNELAGPQKSTAEVMAEAQRKSKRG